MRAFTATTTLQELLPFNKKRTALVIINRSGVECFISEDQSAVAAQGISLAVGQALSLALYKGDEPANALYVITGAATTELRIAESFGPREDPSLRTL